MADSTPKSYSTDPTLYLYTSLTAGSSHIVTATSRLETILKSNRIPFQALDVATDEKARMLWGRRAGKKKLPGLVRMGMIIGDLEQIEEWNEYGELKENIGSGATSLGTPSDSANPTPNHTPSKAPSSLAQADKPKAGVESSPSPLTDSMRRAGEEAARLAGERKPKPNFGISRNEGVDKAIPSVDKSLSQAAVVPPSSGTVDADLPTRSRSNAGDFKEPEAPANAPPAGNATSISPLDDKEPHTDHTLSPQIRSGHTTTHRGSNVSTASAEIIRDIEKALVIPEEPEAEEEGERRETGQAIIDEGSEDGSSHQQTLEPKTQDQPAASGELAGASVAD